MLEDKRVIKTKKNLKETLINMLSEKSFESITVKDLCEKACTSRVTFYTHYHDKYELMDDISHDMINIAREEYARLQSGNNASKDPTLSYCNFLESVLNMYYKNLKLFSHTNSYENPYLNFSFYKYMLEYLEIHTKKRSNKLKPKYSIKKIVGFLCYGLWGFINEGMEEKCPIDQIKNEAVKLMKELIQSEVLTSNA